MKGIHGPHGNIGNVALSAENYHEEKDLVKICPDDEREARSIVGSRTLLEGPSPPCVLSIDWNHPNTAHIEGDTLHEVLSQAGEIMTQAGYKFYHPRFHSRSTHHHDGSSNKIEIIPADTNEPNFWWHHFYLLAVHPSDRCFPEESTKWKNIVANLLNGEVSL